MKSFTEILQPLTRWQRFKRRVIRAIDRARLRLGSWIAGVDLDQGWW